MRALALLESRTRRGSGRSKEREWKNTSGGGRRRAGNGGSDLEHTHQQGQNVSVVHRSTRGWPLGRHAGASCAACELSAGVVRVKEEAPKSGSDWLLPLKEPSRSNVSDVSVTYVHQSNKNACSFCSERHLRTGVGVTSSEKSRGSCD